MYRLDGSCSPIIHLPNVSPLETLCDIIVFIYGLFTTLVKNTVIAPLPPILPLSRLGVLVTDNNTRT